MIGQSQPVRSSSDYGRVTKYVCLNEVLAIIGVGFAVNLASGIRRRARGSSLWELPSGSIDEPRFQVTCACHATIPSSVIQPVRLPRSTGGSSSSG
jgi:hypothetical protein